MIFTVEEPAFPVVRSFVALCRIGSYRHGLSRALPGRADLGEAQINIKGRPNQAGIFCSTSHPSLFSVCIFSRLIRRTAIWRGFQAIKGQHVSITETLNEVNQ
jgi:hypothetical protein